VWQLPSLAAFGVILLAGIGAAVALRPKPDFEGMLDRAEAIISEEKYEEGLDYLNARVFPFVDKAGMTSEQRARFHVLVARTIYLWQSRAAAKREENYQNVWPTVTFHSASWMRPPSGPSGWWAEKRRFGTLSPAGSSRNAWSAGRPARGGRRS
jgi:hypothetical protein